MNRRAERSIDERPSQVCRSGPADAARLMHHAKRSMAQDRGARMDGERIRIGRIHGGLIIVVDEYVMPSLNVVQTTWEAGLRPSPCLPKATHRVRACPWVGFLLAMSRPGPHCPGVNAAHPMAALYPDEPCTRRPVPKDAVVKEPLLRVGNPEKRRKKKKKNKKKKLEPAGTPPKETKARGVVPGLDPPSDPRVPTPAPPWLTSPVEVVPTEAVPSGTRPAESAHHQPADSKQAKKAFKAKKKVEEEAEAMRERAQKKRKKKKKKKKKARDASTSDQGPDLGDPYPALPSVDPFGQSTLSAAASSGTDPQDTDINCETFPCLMTSMKGQGTRSSKKVKEIGQPLKKKKTKKHERSLDLAPTPLPLTPQETCQMEATKDALILDMLRRMGGRRKRPKRGQDRGSRETTKKTEEVALPTADPRSNSLVPVVQAYPSPASSTGIVPTAPLVTEQPGTAQKGSSLNGPPNGAKKRKRKESSMLMEASDGGKPARKRSKKNPKVVPTMDPPRLDVSDPRQALPMQAAPMEYVVTDPTVEATKDALIQDMVSRIGGRIKRPKRGQERGSRETAKKSEPLPTADPRSNSLVPVVQAFPSAASSTGIVPTAPLVTRPPSAPDTWSPHHVPKDFIKEKMKNTVKKAIKRAMKMKKARGTAKGKKKARDNATLVPRPDSSGNAHVPPWVAPPMEYIPTGPWGKSQY